MKQILIVLYVSLQSVWCVYGQSYSIGNYDTLHSTILNEERRILVHIPDNGVHTNVRYPVLYLLDGDAHFTKTVGIIDHLSNTAGNELCPQFIVVAIYHPNRESDLIPPASKEDKAKDKFPEFLEKELIPYINSHYPTEPFRVLVGHSLGGLRVINTLVYQPQLFNSYIALDPSLGHFLSNQKRWIENAKPDLYKNSLTDKTLYIAMGMTMPKGMDTAAIAKDNSGNARHMRSIMDFANTIERNKNGLDYTWKYYPDESHQSVVFKGTYDGLIANFHWYKNEKLFDIFKTDVSADSSVKIITDYYEFLTSKMGYKQLPPEQGTSELIDYLIFKKWYDKVFAFAELNLQNYPNSQKAKSQFQAAKWYTKKSISLLFPKQSTKQIYKLVKIEALKKEPEYNISEDAINAFGYELMQQNKLTDAELIFKLNIELYPDSYNVYDSYGECLLKVGKEKEGIEAYKKSLELNPNNTNAKNVLAKYLNKK
jgi:predicted alpha/beta superfamily hydrolase